MRVVSTIRKSDLMSHQIQAELLPTEYCPTPHLVITVDGAPLDQILVAATGDESFLGLIPAWLGDMTDPTERKIVWDRIQQPTGTNTKVPVLMCPDDLDLWCSVILADTTRADDTVTWHALGTHAGRSDGLPHSIGLAVDWLPAIGPFRFDRAAYDACVARFRLDLEANGR